LQLLPCVVLIFSLKPLLVAFLFCGVLICSIKTFAVHLQIKSNAKVIIKTAALAGARWAKGQRPQ